MTAKPAQQPAAPAGLVDSLQAEVAAEASPLMLFLVAHARKIALVLVLFILAIGGYWFYASKADKVALEDAQALGAILIISDPAMRLERLNAYAPSAPDSVRRETWYAIANAATQVNDFPRAYTAWETILGFAPELKATASLGMAGALAQQEKYAEALALLNGALAGLKEPDAINVNMRIVLLAEALGDYPRAIAACDAILSTAEAAANPGSLNQYGQKKAELEEKLSAAKK